MMVESDVEVIDWLYVWDEGEVCVFVVCFIELDVVDCVDVGVISGIC